MLNRFITQFPPEHLQSHRILAMASPPLPIAVEELLEAIRIGKSTEPADYAARRELERIGEDQALEILGKIAASKARIKNSLSAFIVFMARKYGSFQPRTPEGGRAEPACSQESVNFSGSSRPNFDRFRDDISAVSTSSELPHYKAPLRQPPITVPPRQPPVAVPPTQLHIMVPPTQQPITILEALGMLEFRKAFLTLSYAGRKELDRILSVDSIIKLKALPMVSFERELWNIVKGKNCIPESDRRKNFDWDSSNANSYVCCVDSNGGTTFKGPYLQDTSCHLHRVLGDDNVLMVKFVAEGDCSDFFPTYHKIAEEGITVGLRRYRFFVFKDGGKEKKKSPTSTVNCYFVRTESNWSMDVTASKPYILCNKSMPEARSIFMHVHTVSSVAKYMARFSLILSKTMKLDIDFSSVNIRSIDDIPCRDTDGRIVHDEDGEVMIHTDGTGFISEDLAKRCPRRICKGCDVTPKDFEVRDFSQFCNPYAVIGSKHVQIFEKFLGGLKAVRRDSAIGKLFSLSDEPPLLIQVRLFYNGDAVKGTLLVDKRLPPETICYRPSMLKVERDQNSLAIQHCNSLEVVGTGNLPRRTYLSKSIIALLHYGGVPKEYFLELLRDAMSNAVDGRCQRRSALRVALVHGKMDNFLLARMILCGIPLDEPYMQSRLLLMMREELNSLKTGKIPVNDCYNLMGTADPTGCLKQNEVCIILENGQISGDVLVYKHPGLHFGDVHMLTAVFVKDIEKVVGNSKYAIFFPTKGPRSLADEMANSDFDGDLYWVSRNPQFIQNFRVSMPWKWRRSKPRLPKQKEPTEFSSEELERILFHNFLKTRFTPSYTMSEASDSWMAYMDRLLTPTVCAKEKLCLHDKILEIIDKYYLALDAPKKGLKVEVPKHLKADKYPHFLERSKPSYKSTSILGEIYDEVASFQIEDRQLNEVHMLPCLSEPAPEHCVNLWGKRYDDYRNDMAHALGERDENLKKSAANHVIQKYKRMLYGAEEFEKSPRNQADVFDEALAIYQIVYRHVGSQENKRGSSCGFAWRVAGRALCMLHAKKVGDDSGMICLPFVLQEIF